MDLPLYHLSETWWQEVYKKVKSAVVFIDNTMCECLHWHGGATKLFSAGAVACKEFSSFESGSSSQYKGVFLTSGPIIDTKREVVRDIITASKFQHCVVITAAGPTVQMFAEKRKTGHDMSAFQQLEHDLFKWMGSNKEFVVELLSFPLFLAPITSNVFIMPIFNHLFPPFFDKEREMLNDWSPRENKQKIEMNSLPFGSRVDAFHLMSCLQSLLSLLNLNDDIYCMGQLSEIIANCLETHPQTLSRRKKSSERASLILIDRNLDVAAAATYSSDCLFDRIKASLPNLPEHGCDVAIDMTPISGLKANKLRSKSGKSLLVSSGIPPGCLSHPESSVPVIDWIINQKQYDILINLQKILLNKSNLRITAQSFEKQILSTFSGKHDLIHEHSSVLQQSLAVITALTSHDVDMVIGIEKLLLMAIAAGGTTEALTQLSTAIRTREGRGLTIEQLLVVLVHLYSVIGPDVENSPDAEMLVQAELCKAINEDRQNMDALMNNNSVLLDLGVDEAMGVNDEEVLVRSIFVALRRISKSRHNLVRYRSLMKKESSVFPAEYVPLIQQLFNDLLNPQVHEIPQDLISISSSNKSGLSSLLMRPGRHPMDNKVILVFIVGGITGHEIRLMNELFKSTGKHLIIGSNRFLSPTDVLRSLFTDHSDYRTCIDDQNKRDNSF